MVVLKSAINHTPIRAKGGRLVPTKFDSKIAEAIEIRHDVLFGIIIHTEQLGLCKWRGVALAVTIGDMRRVTTRLYPSHILVEFDTSGLNETKRFAEAQRAFLSIRGIISHQLEKL
jgi:hypothetical protein